MKKKITALLLAIVMVLSVPMALSAEEADIGDILAGAADYVNAAQDLAGHFSADEYSAAYYIPFGVTVEKEQTLSEIEKFLNALWLFDGGQSVSSLIYADDIYGIWEEWEIFRNTDAGQWEDENGRSVKDLIGERFPDGFKDQDWLYLAVNDQWIWLDILYADLFEVLENALTYQYAVPYTYHGSFALSGYDIDYLVSPINAGAGRAGVISDLDRFFGAARLNNLGKGLQKIVYNDTEYLWDETIGHTGSNWASEGATLISALSADLRAAAQELTAELFFNDEPLSFTLHVTVADTYGLKVGGVWVTKENKNDIFGNGGASYDPITKTLTLGGLNLKTKNDTCLYCEHDLTVVLEEGTATSLATEISGAKASEHPAVCVFGKLTFTGDGSLIVGEFCDSTVEFSMENYSIGNCAVYAGDELFFRDCGGTICIGALGEQSGEGIYAQKSISFENCAHVELASADEEAIYISGGNLTISNTNMEASVSDTSDEEVIDVMPGWDQPDDEEMGKFRLLNGSCLKLKKGNDALASLWGGGIYALLLTEVRDSKLDIQAAYGMGIEFSEQVIFDNSEIKIASVSDGIGCDALHVLGASDVTVDSQTGYALDLGYAECVLEVEDGALLKLTGSESALSYESTRLDLRIPQGTKPLGSVDYHTFTDLSEAAVTFPDGDEAIGSAYIGGDYARSLLLGRKIACEGTHQTALRADTLTLTLNGKEAGEFTFEPTENGWAIQKEGVYLAMENGTLTESSEPFEWRYGAGGFSAAVQTEAAPTQGFWFLFWYIPGSAGKTVTTTYYLTTTQTGGALSTRPAATAFLETGIYPQHSCDTYFNLRNGTHRQHCADCGITQTVNCVYDYATHRCACGAYDPSESDVSAEITTDTKTVRGWFWIPYQVYTATITVSGEDARFAYTEYSFDAKIWRSGTSVTAYAPITHLYVRVTDAHGAVHLFEFPQD